MDKFEQDIMTSNQRVLKILYDGKEYYAKKNRKSGKNPFHRLQSVLFHLTRNAFFAPTVLGRHENGVLYEAEKLIMLKGLGLNVPAVIKYSDRYFVMEDCGVRLDAIVGKSPERDREYLREAITELAKLHRCRECHGGCQLRNFTWKGNRVFMIDFEERIRKEHFDGIALRDLLMFLLSAIRVRADSVDWTMLIECYEAKSGLEVKSRLFKVLKSASFLRILTKKPFTNMLSRDAIDTLAALESLQIQAR